MPVSPRGSQWCCEALLSVQSGLECRSCPFCHVPHESPDSCVVEVQQVSFSCTDRNFTEKFLRAFRHEAGLNQVPSHTHCLSFQ